MPPFQGLLSKSIILKHRATPCAIVFHPFRALRFMLLSVIIPTYRRPQLLLKCLERLCQQNFLAADFEITVVTDGPDELTAQAVKALAIQHPEIILQCISPTKKGGPAAARNVGWKVAKGELILFTDDDTLPDENWLAGYYAAYTKGDKKEMAFTGKTVVPVSAQPTDFEKNTAGLETAEFITANCACTKPALEKVGGFDEHFTMAWREDSDLHFKFIYHNIPIQKVEAAIVVHPVRQAPWGVSIREQKKGMFNALLYKKHPKLYAEKIGARPLWNYYAMIGLILFLFFFLIARLWLPALIAFVLWGVLVVQFTQKRLKGARKSWSHIGEMLYTSAIIPFHSIYWTLYGSVRFKKTLF